MAAAKFLSIFQSVLPNLNTENRTSADSVAPALLSSPRLSSLISQDSLKALAYTADLSLWWLLGVLYWAISTIVSFGLHNKWAND